MMMQKWVHRFHGNALGRVAANSWGEDGLETISYQMNPVKE
jgi:hypothetical protein